MAAAAAGPAPPGAIPFRYRLQAPDAPANSIPAHLLKSLANGRMRYDTAFGTTVRPCFRRSLAPYSLSLPSKMEGAGVDTWTYPGSTGQGVADS